MTQQSCLVDEFFFFRHLLIKSHHNRKRIVVLIALITYRNVIVLSLSDRCAVSIKWIKIHAETCLMQFNFLQLTNDRLNEVWHFLHFQRSHCCYAVQCTIHSFLTLRFSDHLLNGFVVQQNSFIHSKSPYRRSC